MSLLVLEDKGKGYKRNKKEERRQTKGEPTRRQEAAFIREEVRRNAKEGVDAWGKKLTQKQHLKYFGEDYHKKYGPSLYAQAKSKAIAKKNK